MRVTSVQGYIKLIIDMFLILNFQANTVIGKKLTQ